MVWAGRESCIFLNVSVQESRYNLVPLRRLPEGTLQVPREVQAAPPLAPDPPDEGGRTFCDPEEVSPES